MTELVSEDLGRFLQKMCGVPISKITLEKDLIQDLELWGDDFWELIYFYGRDFGVDLSHVDWEAFHQSEGKSFFDGVWDVVRGILRMQRPPLEPTGPEPRITVADLQRGIKNRRLVLKDC